MKFVTESQKDLGCKVHLKVVSPNPVPEAALPSHLDQVAQGLVS